MTGPQARIAHTPLALLRERRFAPYFVTQLAGAFNDNVYKNALVALVAFSATRVASGDDALVINLAAALFILPFFLFSDYAGQIADRHEKAALIRRIKLAEVAIMATGAAAFALGSLPLALAVLFLMGTQSAFFGPLKYAILPTALAQEELVRGNALVELGTFLAILLGTIAGTQLVARAPGGSAVPVAAALLGVAVLGWLSSRAIPPSAPAAADLVPRLAPLTGAWRLVRETAAERTVFQSIVGISWFWLLGATYLAQLPVYTRDVLGADVDVFTLFLAVFSLSVGMGSLLAERLSGDTVELGLVPLAAAGLSLGGLALAAASPAAPLAAAGEPLGVVAFLATGEGRAIALALALIGLSGGLYAVPLYALVQSRAQPERLARAIACNNVMNALFMVVSALVSLALLAAGLPIVGLFVVAAVANALVALHIFRLVPEFAMRCLVWLLVNALYRVRPSGLGRIPREGAAILVCNHPSYVDALVIAGCVRRPTRFVTHHSLYRLPPLGFVFRTARAIPIASRREDPALYERAFVEMRAALEAGELLCIFPEGGITRTGAIEPFRPGVLRLLETHPVPVVPMALVGLDGSLFARAGSHRGLLARLLRPFRRVELRVGEARAAGAILGPETLRAEVQALHDATTIAAAAPADARRGAE